MFVLITFIFLAYLVWRAYFARRNPTLVDQVQNTPGHRSTTDSRSADDILPEAGQAQNSPRHGSRPGDIVEETAPTQLGRITGLRRVRSSQDQRPANSSDTHGAQSQLRRVRSAPGRLPYKENPQQAQMGERPRDSLVCLWICLLGGLAIGYLNAIPGMVLSMNDFINKVSRNLLYQIIHKKINNYCPFLNMGIQVFLASAQISQMIGVIVSPFVRAKWGEKKTLMGSSLAMLVGVALILWFPNTPTTCAGFLLLNIGVGITSKVISVIASRLAPNNGSWLFDVATIFGTLAATSIIYGLSSTYKPWVWRVTVGIIEVVISSLMLSTMFLTNFPIFQTKINQLKEAQNLIKPLSRPPLIISLVKGSTAFFTAVGVIQFYSPMLFTSATYQSPSIYLTPLIMTSIQTFFRLLVLVLVRFLGRRKILLFAATVKIVIEIAICVTFYRHSHPYTYFDYPLRMLTLGAIYVALDGCMTAPNGWLEVTYREVLKSIGSILDSALGPLQNAITASVSVLLFCRFSKGIFLLYLTWDILIGIFIVLWVPETFHVTQSSIAQEVWSKHWFWKKHVKSDDSYV